MMARIAELMKGDCRGKVEVNRGPLLILLGSLIGRPEAPPIDDIVELLVDDLDAD